MAVTINASTTSGLQLTSDTSGEIVLQNNGTTGVTVDTSGNATVRGALAVNGTGTHTIAGTLQFNSGYGSVATAYACRAWVNFNGTGTVAIRASGNVSSITDNGIGNYNINFTTAMTDANYSALVTQDGPVNNEHCVGFVSGLSTTTFNLGVYDTSSSFRRGDPSIASIAVLR